MDVRCALQARAHTPVACVLNHSPGRLSVIIALDVDDVVADLHPAWVEAINRAYGTKWTVEDMQEWDFYKAWGLTDSQVYAVLTPELYGKVKPCEGALEVVEALR